MEKKFKRSGLAVFVASCTLLVGCGSDDDSTQTKTAAYDYKQYPICVDADLSGTCDALETTVTNLEQKIQGQSAPYLINHGDNFLTAPAAAKIISPFTTLIQSEMMFNPSVSGSQVQAEQHLQAIFGEKYGINFSELSSIHGPQALTDQLLASFRHALTLQGDSSYLKIAAAVDKMIREQSFDITSHLTQTDLDTHFLNLDKRYLLAGSYTTSALAMPQSITVNPGNGMLLALLANEQLMQMDTATGAYASFSPAVESAAALPQTEMGGYQGFDHDDDDDDDDDDWYPVQKPSVLSFAAQGKDNQQAYLLYRPSLNGNTSVSNTCTSTGENGIFFTEIGGNSQSQPLPAEMKIDSFGGASSLIPPVTAQPSVPVSSAQCRNNHINAFTPLYKQDQLVAVFTNGSYQHSELQLLSSKTLAPQGVRYPLSTTQPLLVADHSQQQLLVVDGTSNQATILDSQTLKPKATLGTSDISAAVFTNNDSSLIVSDGTERLHWYEISAPGSVSTTLDLGAPVIGLAVSPDGQLSAALAGKRLYIIDNQSRQVILSQAYQHAYPYGMSMLNDKVIISRYGALDYIQFGNLIGSPAKVGYQLITRDLIHTWAAKASHPFSPTTLSYLLETTGAEASISGHFSNLDVEWLPANATAASDVKTVVLSGYFRGERIRMYKHL
ncbi:YncE family protein [Photobacterium sp. TY1-4]|uniref:YncE family protein n=1 Tax=Photobacterium sp. TY1-4 TaxID=2899122 RepID=UPI0021BEDF50|nr:hypothetical protein [Photobacterium sp. TY1-4]UXI03621.1 hypothetical protein NH461_24710 [Photobacterium sp. TY1-4]